MDHSAYLSLNYSTARLYIKKMDMLRRDAYEDRHPAIALADKEIDYLPQFVQALLQVLDSKKVFEKHGDQELKSLCRDLKHEIKTSSQPLSESMKPRVDQLRTLAQIMFPKDTLENAIKKSLDVDDTGVWFMDVFEDELSVFDDGLKQIRRIIKAMEDKWPELLELKKKLAFYWEPENVHAAFMRT